MKLTLGLRRRLKLAAGPLSHECAPERKPPDESSGGRKSESRPGGRGQTEDSEDPRQLQGIATARHADQRSPVWPAPQEAGPLDDLEAAWRWR